jgi:8-oxo-dGTP pyrophosphatase MutT (NUDIX family)
VQERVAVLICRDDCLLLIHRRKEGKEYYVVPGGGREAGESPEEAARREIQEELSLRVELGPVLWQQDNQGRTETYFKAAAVSGDVALGGPEREKLSAANFYEPCWVPLGTLAQINLVPEAARTNILALVRHRQLP